MNEFDKSLPYVRPDHVAVDNGWDLALISCPYCGKEHEHGWSTGRRISHCSPKSRGQYFLDCDEVNAGEAIYRVNGVRVSYQEYIDLRKGRV